MSLLVPHLRFLIFCCPSAIMAAGILRWQIAPLTKRLKNVMTFWMLEN